jgi:hypothetical protein
MSNYKLRDWDPDSYGIHDDVEGNNYAFDTALDEYVRYVIFMIELMISNMRSLPNIPQQFVVLFDSDGFTPRLIFRANVQTMIQKLIDVAQAQYPVRLRTVLLINPPFGFGAAWKLIRPLHDEKTASKIHFTKRLKDLTASIDPSVLSEEYSGTHQQRRNQLRVSALVPLASRHGARYC